MTVIGAKKYTDRIRRITSPAQTARIGRALYKAGQLIEVTAEHLITSGSISGKEHIASKPGEPPNNDTGTLADNIETTKKGPLKVHVSSNAPYAKDLELGTSKMEARPYMRPAVAMKRDEGAAYVQQVVRNSAKGV